MARRASFLLGAIGMAVVFLLITSVRYSIPSPEPTPHGPHEVLLSKRMELASQTIGEAAVANNDNTHLVREIHTLRAEMKQMQQHMAHNYSQLSQSLEYLTNMLRGQLSRGESEADEEEDKKKSDDDDEASKKKPETKDEDLRQIVILSGQSCIDRNPSYPDNMVKLYLCHGGMGGTNQRFWFTASGHIRHTSAYCIAAIPSATPGSKVQMSFCATQVLVQQWTYVHPHPAIPGPGGNAVHYGQLRNRGHPSLCLDFSEKDDALVVSVCSDSCTQFWNISHVEPDPAAALQATELKQKTAGGARRLLENKVPPPGPADTEGAVAKKVIIKKVTPLAAAAVAAAVPVPPATTRPPQQQQQQQLLLSKVSKVNGLHQQAAAPSLKTQINKHTSVGRILCWILTHPGNHATGAVAVNNTWGRECDTLLFISSEPAKGLQVVVLDLGNKESREVLWPKSQQAWMHMYSNFLDKAEWFLKADDDTYVNMPYLREFLSSHSHEQPVYFGRRFNYLGDPSPNATYYSGGAGIVLSREALRRLGDRAMLDAGVWAGPSSGAEDYLLAQTLMKLNIYPVDTRAADGSHRFLTLGIESEHHFLKSDTPDLWFWKFSLDARDGLSCCSTRWITTHYIKDYQMYAIDFIRRVKCKPSLTLFPFLTPP